MSSSPARKLTDAEFESEVQQARDQGYMLSEAISAPDRGLVDLTVFQRLARLAPSLSDSAIRLFVHLWSKQLEDLSAGMMLSTRDLAAITGMSRPSIMAGLDQLYSRDAIILKWGNSGRPNRIFVCLWRGSVLERGGQNFLPPSTSRPFQSGQKFVPPSGVPSAEAVKNFDRPPLQSLDSSCQLPLTDLIDRSIDCEIRSDPPPKNEIPRIVLAASPAQYSQTQLIAAGQLLWQAMQRRGDRKNKPPSDLECAQLLACGSWPEVQRILMAIMFSTGTRIRSYAYFIAAVVQQIHGIGPEEWNQAKQTLKPQLVPKQHKPIQFPAPAPEPAPEPINAEQLGLTPSQFARFEKLRDELPPHTGADLFALIDLARESD